MKNWKDYVGFQPVVEELNKGGMNIFCLECKKMEDSTISFSITRNNLKKKDFKYTEDTIGDVIENLLLSFPRYDSFMEFTGTDSKERDFGFGSYYTYKDDETIHHLNSIKVINPFSIRKNNITCDLTECDEVERELIEEALKKEPKFRWKHFYIPLPYFTTHSKKEKFIAIQFSRIRNDIAKNSRRGRGNKKIVSGDSTVLFYSSSAYDSPIFVSEYNGKYAIMKHPDFEKYGYVVKT